MNAVDIESAVSDLFSQPFDETTFPFAFLEAFGNKATTIARLKSGGMNHSDGGGVLQRNNIHIACAQKGDTSRIFSLLKASPATYKHKARYLFATDGQVLEAEDVATGESLACDFADFPNHFGFFLALAGIHTVKAIRDSAFDIRATARLNRLYLELMKENPDWGQGEKRHEMNHFMARLIFCFFAEDTAIFYVKGLFTETLAHMSDADGKNTHEIIGALFRAMDTPLDKRDESYLPLYAKKFPYVNGGLFENASDVPRFSKTARTYLAHIGSLDWAQVNPDIFGSMIQAVADEEERGALGMHYTSVPNILKVLNPLFLDDLRQVFEKAKPKRKSLIALRDRLAHIRIFDPACGSGNFLVIAYKELRALENEINEALGEIGRKSMIPLTNFRGIELKDFSAEIARLALVIAEYQANVRYLGQKEALDEFLPLSSENWITCGNALCLDWESLCPPSGSAVRLVSNDLLETPLNQAEIDFESEAGETYICGNPPYLGSTWQSPPQKADLKALFEGRAKNWASLDYVAGWFLKAADYCGKAKAAAAFVSTNSICQGQQVPILWPLIFAKGCEIFFAHTSFKWANLASHNAGVTVVIVGISQEKRDKRLFAPSSGKSEASDAKVVPNINAYLVAGANVMVQKTAKPLSEQAEMSFGNKPVDGGHLLLSSAEVLALDLNPEQKERFIRRIYGSAEFIRGLSRYCLWIEDQYLDDALAIPAIKKRIEKVRAMRLASKDTGANEMAKRAHQMREMNTGRESTIVVPRVSSENRPYLPVGILEGGTIIGDRNFALYDAPLWNLALIASRLHWVWIATVCVRMRTDFSYSNTLGWNTFPLPALTQKQKDDLTRSAKMLAREAHFPKTIADLYGEKMPESLRAAHEANDELLERIYIGRRFKSDTERLEKLFALYTQMTDKTKGEK